MLIDKIVFKYRILESNIAPKECIFKYPTTFDKSNFLLPLNYENLPNDRFLWA